MGQFESRKMNPCNHDLAERETAVADGYCPLCMVTMLAEDRAHLVWVVEKWREYVEWLAEKNHGPITLAWVHGWRCPEEDIAEGQRRRAELADVGAGKEYGDGKQFKRLKEALGKIALLAAHEPWVCEDIADAALRGEENE